MPPVLRDDRRLCVFFSAGATRYALDAVRVLEVSRANESGELHVPHHTTVRDLSALLGGEDEPNARAGVTVDVSPTLALRVKQVDGVFATADLPRWPVQGRLIPLVAPAVGAALEFEGRLVFELDAEGTARGLPRQVRPLVRLTREAEQVLCFWVDEERLAIPLHHVVQVIEADAHFNRCPNAGTLLGIALHRSRLCPVFTVGELGLVHPFVVLFEVNGDLIGLSVSRVEGVRAATSLDGVPILDVGRMFS